MQIKSNVAISDSGFLFNPSSGESYTVNPIGVEIINFLKSGKNKIEIIDLLQDKYTTEKDILERDINDFMNMLRQYRLINFEEDEEA